MIQTFELTWTNIYIFTRFLICKKEKRTLTALIGNNFGDTQNTGILLRYQNHFNSADQKAFSSPEPVVSWSCGWETKGSGSSRYRMSENF